MFDAHINNVMILGDKPQSLENNFCLFSNLHALIALVLVLFIVYSLLQVKLVSYHLNKTWIWQAPRKSTSSERLPSKEDNKIQVSTKSSKEENKV